MGTPDYIPPEVIKHESIDNDGVLGALFMNY